ncbi:hypothetical protein ACHAXR_009492 [Thalassiosira sp. AJA248-18]
MMSTTPYQGSSATGTDGTEDPLPPVSAAASVPTHAPARRRKSPSSSPTSLSLPLSLSSELHEESSINSSSNSTASDDNIDGDTGSRPSMKEMMCTYLCGRSRELILGQLLSLMLAGTGAIQSSLYLDCHLSAPTFSMLSFYCPLCIFSLGRLAWKERRHKLCCRQKSSSSLSEQDRSLIQQQGNDGSDNETNDDSENGAQQSSESQRQMPGKAAKPEKRNHLLSRWSQYPPAPETTETSEHDRFYIDGNSGLESNNAAANAQTSSSQSKPYTLLGLIPLQISWHNYAAIAFFDVYANYTTILAFKYTTITSVSLFDALAIPSTIILSRTYFGRRYTKVHLIGVMVCCIGIGLNVLIDYREDKDLEEAASNGGGDGNENAQTQMIEENYPHKSLGDFLAIMGGLLFGIDNTLMEVAVKRTTLLEYMGCTMFFATIISLVQAMILEREEIMAFFTQPASDTCSAYEGPLRLFFFMIGGMVQYLGISAFLQKSDSAFFNLSVLTGDAWAVAFSVFAEGILPSSLFYIALAITVSGVFIYETAPSPVLDDKTDDDALGEVQLTETMPDGPSDQDGHELT